MKSKINIKFKTPGFISQPTASCILLPASYLPHTKKLKDRPNEI